MAKWTGAEGAALQHWQVRDPLPPPRLANHCITWPVHSSPCFPSHSSMFSFGSLPSELQSNQAHQLNYSQDGKAIYEGNEPSTQDMGPFGVSFKFSQSAGEDYYLLKQSVHRLHAEDVHTHDALLINDDLCQQFVPGKRVQNQTTLALLI
jgi:hypothetical protein